MNYEADRRAGRPDPGQGANPRRSGGTGTAPGNINAYFVRIFHELVVHLRSKSQDISSGYYRRYFQKDCIRPDLSKLL